MGNNIRAINQIDAIKVKIHIMNNISKIFSISILMLLIMPSICRSQDILDLHNLTFNDSIIKELNIEKVTDMLGRPTATNNNSKVPAVIVDAAGAKIYYHNKGLMFWFKPKSEDTQKRVWFFEIYLVKKWDKDFNEFFLPYSGKIEPEINPNMKSEKLISLFNTYNPKIESAEECRKGFEESMKKDGFFVKSDIAHDRVIINTYNGKINLHCEELTKFLEFLTIIPE
jgi:hypothetical protein